MNEKARATSASRRAVLRGAGAVAALGAAGFGGHRLHRWLRPPADPATEIDLYSQTVAFDAAGQRQLIPADPAADGTAATDSERLEPDTRLTVRAAAEPESSARSSSPAAKFARFRESTLRWRQRVPHEFVSLADSALSDLWVLSEDLPAPVAAWTPYWRYVWPRDTAFCVVALARTGNPERALDALRYLQSVQRPDGWFEARYIPGTDRSPDSRARQFDGTGLLLWAAHEVTEAVATGAHETGISAAEVLSSLEPLISASQQLLLDATRDGTDLPPVSPDYWEVGERSVTLGIMASTLAGLRSAAAITGEERSAMAAESFAALVTDTFGPAGFQRYRRRGGADSARAFFDATGCHGIITGQALTSLHTELARPGGGIAPGASWRQDGISWTPSTTLLGLALARTGQARSARSILHWVAEHRTAAGSIPEKVLFNGRPAAVAPLSWSAANVVLTIDSLLGR